MSEFDDLDLTELGKELIADSSTYTPPPAGNHIARCIGFFQLGTQKTEFQGIPGKSRRKIMLTWELPEDLNVFDEAKGPQPFFISQIYSLVMGDKSTYAQHMTGWNNGVKIKNDFNPFSLLGKACSINIEHRASTKDPSKMRAKILSIAGLRKSETCPDRISDFQVLLFSKWNEELFDQQSDWIKDTIKASPEYKAMGMPSMTGNNEGKFRNEYLADDLSNL